MVLEVPGIGQQGWTLGFWPIFPVDRWRFGCIYGLLIAKLFKI